MYKTESAKNATSPEVLDSLSREPHWLVRCYVAANPNTSPETLIFLGMDDNQVVQAYVAENLRTPPDTLNSLCDCALLVRWSAVRNPNTPYGVWANRYGRVLP